jgi:hypothetical protein
MARAPWAEVTRAPGRSRTLAKALEAKLARCSVVGGEARSPRHGWAERGLRGTDRNPSAPRLIRTRRPRTYELGHAAEPNHRTKPLTFERKAGEPWNRPAPLQGETASLAAERASRGRIHDARSDLPRAFDRVKRRRPRTNTHRRKPPDRQILKAPKWASAISAPSRSIPTMNKELGSLQYQNRLSRNFLVNKFAVFTHSVHNLSTAGHSLAGCVSSCNASYRRIRSRMRMIDLDCFEGGRQSDREFLFRTAGRFVRLRTLTPLCGASNADLSMLT